MDILHVMETALCLAVDAIEVFLRIQDLFIKTKTLNCCERTGIAGHSDPRFPSLRLPTIHHECVFRFASLGFPFHLMRRTSGRLELEFSLLLLKHFLQLQLFRSFC